MRGLLLKFLTWSVLHSASNYEPPERTFRPLFYAAILPATALVAGCQADTKIGPNDTVPPSQHSCVLAISRTGQ